MPYEALGPSFIGSPALAHSGLDVMCWVSVIAMRCCFFTDLLYHSQLLCRETAESTHRLASHDALMHLFASTHPQVNAVCSPTSPQLLLSTETTLTTLV